MMDHKRMASLISGRRLRRQVSSQILVHFVLTLGMVLMLLPFFWMVSTALKGQGGIYAMPPQLIPKPPTLLNFERLFAELDFFTYFCNSLFISVTYTFLALIITSTAGYVFAKLPFPGRSFFFGIVLATAMIPGILTTIPGYILVKYLGWLDSYKVLIIPPLGNVFFIFCFRQYMQTLPDELLEAARIDGASEMRSYFSIVMPNCKPVISTLAILGFVGKWNDFLWPSIVISNPAKQVLEVQLYTLFNLNSGQQMGLVMAGATIALIPLIIVFLIGQKYIVRGIAMSGLKG